MHQNLLKNLLILSVMSPYSHNFLWQKHGKFLPTMFTLNHVTSRIPEIALRQIGRFSFTKLHTFIEKNVLFSTQFVLRPLLTDSIFERFRMISETRLTCQSFKMGAPQIIQTHWSNKSIPSIFSST